MLAPAVHKVLSSRQPAAAALLPTRTKPLVGNYYTGRSSAQEALISLCSGTYYLGIEVKLENNMLLVDFFNDTYRLEGLDDSFEKARAQNRLQAKAIGEDYYL